MRHPDYFDRYDADEEGEQRNEPGTVACNRCGATDVYWMTVLGRREATFLAKNGTPKALKLAKAKLYNVSGGEHVCPLSADDFGVEP